MESLATSRCLQFSEPGLERKFRVYLALAYQRNIDPISVAALNFMCISGLAAMLWSDGRHKCYGIAISYLVLALINAALQLLPQAALRMRWRTAAVTMLRLAYMVPCCLLMYRCEVAFMTNCTPKGCAQRLMFCSGLIYLMWYGVTLPLALPAHALVQLLMWAAVSSTMGTDFCVHEATGACAGRSDIAANVRRASSALGLMLPNGDWGLQQLTGKLLEKHPRYACTVLVQHMLFCGGLLLPVWLGYVFEASARRRFAGQLGLRAAPTPSCFAQVLVAASAAAAAWVGLIVVVPRLCTAVGPAAAARLGCAI